MTGVSVIPRPHAPYPQKTYTAVQNSDSVSIHDTDSDFETDLTEQEYTALFRETDSQ